MDVLFSTSLYFRPLEACLSAERAALLRQNVLVLAARLAWQTDSLQIPQVEKVASLLSEHAGNEHIVAEVRPARTC